MTAEKRYQGWANYETWAVNLWIGNEEPAYRHWRAVARECWAGAEADTTLTREERAALDLADRLKCEFEEANPLAESASVWSDLLGAALAEVNWLEIARHMIFDCDKTEGPSDESE